MNGGTSLGVTRLDPRFHESAFGVNVMLARAFSPLCLRARATWGFAPGC